MMFKKILALSFLLPVLAYAEADIPSAIKAPEGHIPVLAVHAKGDQIYQCVLDKGGYFWQVQAPDARLFDDAGKVVGNHYAGPVWEYKEGSRVQGEVLGKVELTPESSISWLLVKVVSHKGTGMFDKVDYINRINTHGGLAPKSGCDGNHLGGEKRVAYSADYVFYGKPLN